MRISDWSSDVCSSDLGRRSAAFSAFARAWRRGYEPAMTTRTCQLYLISPLDVGGDFPARLEEALAAAAVAAFQFRVKGVDKHDAARLAAPLQAICAAHETPFLVNADMAPPTRHTPTRRP